ncbi:Aste57867_20752 [Aphanomyces stellatus]|uniref:Aste57867_20752 protein n=1 Tax=Aphanomyces stellatus TaxID=120398 RepID=A0A485LGE6_9STRA|nr:hypothetical protein As57867_020684 [Aphanomyces stellatus]VFT97431.1 Aste57867_20752 [Aphanomyces stellatus]
MQEIVRSGILFKRGCGRGFFQRRNWKPRYFELSYDSLSYFDYHQGTLKGTISLTLCTADDIEVMPADCIKTGSSASTIWRLAINAPERRLVLSMDTEAEMQSWEDSFRHVLQANAARRKSYPEKRRIVLLSSHKSVREPRQPRLVAAVKPTRAHVVVAIAGRRHCQL